jgi:hypothetical protein
MNLTKTVRKMPIDLDLSAAGGEHEDHGRAAPKYDDADKWVRPFFGLWGVGGVGVEKFGLVFCCCFRL